MTITRLICWRETVWASEQGVKREKRSKRPSNTWVLTRRTLERDQIIHKGTEDWAHKCTNTFLILVKLHKCTATHGLPPYWDTNMQKANTETWGIYYHSTLSIDWPISVISEQPLTNPITPKSASPHRLQQQLSSHCLSTPERPTSFCLTVSHDLLLSSEKWETHQAFTPYSGR